MSGPRYEVGIDEVGRGPLAGPVCVGVCALEKRHKRRVFALLRGARDSKRLSPAKRYLWFSRISALRARGLLHFATAMVGQRTIDRRGISFALRVCIRRSIRKLALPSSEAEFLLDGGLSAPRRYPFQKTIIGGDETEPLIALASIIAKVLRDRKMTRYGKKHPAYGFEIHKGYGTRAHYAALHTHGLCELHRRSFLKKFSVDF